MKKIFLPDTEFRNIKIALLMKLVLGNFSGIANGFNFYKIAKFLDNIEMKFYILNKVDLPYFLHNHFYTQGLLQS